MGYAPPGRYLSRRTSTAESISADSPHPIGAGRRASIARRQIWNEVAYTLTASGERKVAGTMLAAYGRILKKRHDPRASDILLRAAELLSVEERTMESS